MKIKQPPACANCKFLHLADNKGECRRYPPQLAGLVTQRVQPKFFARKITSGVSAFPGVEIGRASCRERV